MPAEKPGKGIRTTARRYFEQSAVRERSERVGREENKAIARRYFEDIWNKRNLAAIDEVVAATFVGHAPDATLQGVEALKQRVNTGLAQYPDMHFTIEDIIGEGDKVCVRWIYRATAAGKGMVVAGMQLFRIANGKIEESWLSTNELGA